MGRGNCICILEASCHLTALLKIKNMKKLMKPDNKYLSFIKLWKQFVAGFILPTKGLTAREFKCKNKYISIKVGLAWLSIRVRIRISFKSGLELGGNKSFYFLGYMLVCLHQLQMIIQLNFCTAFKTASL